MTHQKDGDGKFSVAKAVAKFFRSPQDYQLKFFGHSRISDRNPFSAQV
jgi:hypothetical protein